MGKFGKIFIADVLIIAGIVFPPIGPIVFPYAASLLLSAASGILFPPDLGDRTNYIQRMLADPQAGLPIVYGKAKVGMRLLDVRVDRNSPNWVDLWVVGAWCHGGQVGSPWNGAIAEVGDIYFDQYLALPLGHTECTEKYRKGSAHFLYCGGDFLGASNQTAPTPLTTAFPGVWTANHRGRGVAYTALKLIYSVDIYSGMPGAITAIVRGNIVYDVRDSTWKYSDNPALCIYDFLTAPIYGMGVAAEEIDTGSFITCANYCDEMVGAWGAVTQKRFTCNGALDSVRSPKENLGVLLSSCRGSIVYDGGKYRLLIRRPLTQATLTLDNTNIIGDWNFAVPGTRETMNSARCRYVDPTRDYSVQTQQFPEPGVGNNYLIADNNFENVGDFDLPMTTNKWTAQQIGMVILRESRSGLTVQVTCTETALQLQVGDIVPVTHETPGWTAKLFWVLSLGLAADNRVRVTLGEYQSTAYTLDLTTDDPADPGTDLPDPFTLEAPTGLTVLSDASTVLQTDDTTVIPRIKVTWTPPVGAFLASVDVWARKTGTVPWSIQIPVPGDSDPLCYITAGISELESWDVQIRAVNTLGVQSEWSAISTVTVISDIPENGLPFYGTGRTDLIFNGLFEEGGLAYWAEGHNQGPPYERLDGCISLDTTNPYSGTSCFKLHKPTGYYGTFSIQCLNSRRVADAQTKTMWVRVRPGDVYLFGAAMRCSIIPDHPVAYVALTFWDAAKQYISGNNITGGASMSWVVDERTLVVPANAAFARVALCCLYDLLPPDFYVFFDDVHCYRKIGSGDLYTPLTLVAV